uniref:Family with sequence similarity 113 n=1 Tax=Gasterosteus aculeatus aculeatus TaxID=481459 RepID=A0AAQ4RXW8_GASAC|nr:PC-esterase domain-containing protein 1A-like isoform X1 [Gasterosteus aculeatus aculeatus]XP_040035544.1 PC-esterase domain-containing protein 1A-like isoform X1 [Gasterosteus aculeatus aculeatus]XP_040035545.1 PC-esterase domain-containing protein 1A-like isoform X1 [Gasterosteus aculeatus aculeatus]
MSTLVMRNQARQLLHNKFVVVLGGSVQRSMYKDLVLLLQTDQCLTLSQLKSKGEFSFKQDVLVEGGRLGPMTNGTEYREVRQYRSDHHLVRFYFLTRVYSPYMESILEDFRQGLKPDILVVSSCVWDITRYGPECLGQYKENLHKFFGQIKTIVYHDCLILWALALPLSKRINGGFLVPEVSHLAPTLCYDIIAANFYSCRLAEAYGLDVLDLHFHFRFRLQHRMADGVHWDGLAHRRISGLLLHHAADAWGVDLYDPPSPAGGVALQRCSMVRHQQRNRSDQFELVPPNSATDPHMWFPSQPPLCWQQDAAAAGVEVLHSPFPVQPRPPPGPRFPADGRRRLAGQNSLLPDNPWPRQQVYVGVRKPFSQMDFSAGDCFRFCPHSQANDPRVRRGRGRRTNFRTHPYPPMSGRWAADKRTPYSGDTSRLDSAWTEW